MAHVVNNIAIGIITLTFILGAMTMLMAAYTHFEKSTKKLSDIYISLIFATVAGMCWLIAENIFLNNFQIIFK